MSPIGDTAQPPAPRRTPLSPPRPSPRLVLAAHEAGHAVAAAASGLAVGDVLLDPPGLPPGWGVAYFAPNGDRDRHLFVLAAGPAAAACASGTWDDTRDGHDKQAAWDELGEDLTAYYPRAAEWVRRPAVWRAVAAVAAELDRHGRVSGFRVRVLAGRTPRSPAESRRWPTSSARRRPCICSPASASRRAPPGW